MSGRLPKKPSRKRKPHPTNIFNVFDKIKKRKKIMDKDLKAILGN